MSTTKTPTSRVKNVQTPGEAPKATEEGTSRLDPDQVNTAGESGDARAADVEYKGLAVTDELDAQRVNMTTTKLDGDVSADGIVVADAADSVVAKENGIPEDLMERARAEVRAELGVALEVAAKQLQPTTVTPQSRSDYRQMRAADIDATKLSAPVFTLDGWLCPPAAPVSK